MMLVIAVLGAVMSVVASWISQNVKTWGLLPTDTQVVQFESIRVPLWINAVLMSGVFIFIFRQHGETAQTVILWSLAVYFLLIALIDLRYRLVLNSFIYPAFGLVLIMNIWAGQNTLNILLGGAFALFIFLGTALITHGSLGMGDVKLAALIGVLLGFPGVIFGLLIGTGQGGVVAFTLWLRHRTGQMNIPYAPFLCIGACVVLFYPPFGSL